MTSDPQTVADAAERVAVARVQAWLDGHNPIPPKGAVRAGAGRGRRACGPDEAERGPMSRVSPMLEFHAPGTLMAAVAIALAQALGRRPRIADLFCHKGGLGMGYHQAGFDVVGVDIDDMTDGYPFEFVQADAITWIANHGHEFDAIHASPPCQAYTPLNAYNHKTYPDLIAPAREAILATGLPYVIENVEAAAPELKDPTMLCGPMFDLPMYRHRLFETNWALTAPAHPAHVALCARNGYLPTAERPFMSIHGGKHSKAWQRAAAEAMEMPWLVVPDGGDVKAGVRAVCEAVPPAYSRWIGRQLIAQLAERSAAA